MRSLAHLPACRALRLRTHDWSTTMMKAISCAAAWRFSRLIHEYVRGDPSLGWACKEHLIKTVKTGVN